MSLYSRPTGGSGGSIDPAALAALVDDNEATNLYAGIVGTVHQRADALAVAISNAHIEILGSAVLPRGYVAEFPADQVPAGWSVTQGTPESLPTGIGTVSASRTTGPNAGHRGHARTLATNRIWSLYGTTLTALDLATNKFDTQTLTPPVNINSGSGSTGVLHDLTDTAALITIGQSVSNVGDARAYRFDAVSKAFTQVANFAYIGLDGFSYAGQGGTTLRLNDGRLFWLPNQGIRVGTTGTIYNVSGGDGGFYFLYDPVTNVVTSQRLGNWQAVGVSLGTTGPGSNFSGFNFSLPIGQLPDGRLILQELHSTSINSSRYFFIDLAANTITLGAGLWTGGLYAIASHPQGLVCFAAGGTTRRYYNASTDSLDLATATLYSTASVGGSAQGYGYKALPIGNGNFALPAGGSSEAYALAYDSFVRLGTVKARKTY